MRLILVRHGESFWNEQKRVSGFTDIDLNEKGKEQAKRLAIALKKEKVAAIYSSPLKRCVDTAQAIAQLCYLEVNIDPDLKELDTGELEGLPEEEISKRYGEFWKEWRRGSGSLHLPGGESLEELQIRAWRAIHRIAKRHAEEVVVVVSHLFTILVIISQVLGLELRYLRRLRQDEAAISILNMEEQGNSLVLLNGTCHLRE